VLAAACVAGGALAVPLAGGSSAASTATGLAAAVPAGSGAAALLAQAWTRSREDTYHGEQQLTVDGSSSTLRVSHVPGHTYLSPQPGGTAYETDDAPAGDPLAADPMSLLEQHFRLSVVGAATVLGRQATIVQATGTDGVAAQYWVDSTSSLVVRRDTFRHGTLATRAAYTSLVVDQADPALATARSTTVLSRAGSSVPVADLRRAGWVVPASLPGGLSLYDARITGSGSAAVLQLAYSDGVSTASVFEQPGRLGRPSGEWTSAVIASGRTGWRAAGDPVRLAWQAHGLVLALVTDLPTSDVDALVDALPYGPSPGAPSVVGRVDRGLHRIGAALDPFG
jgi:sigma-E factor negative regulatory protein RseB